MSGVSGGTGGTGGTGGMVTVLAESYEECSSECSMNLRSACVHMSRVHVGFIASIDSISTMEGNTLAPVPCRGP